MPRLPLRATATRISELMITAGVISLVYMVYLLWWTGFVADKSAHADVCRLRQQWAASVSVAPRPGQPFATIQIPRIRNPQVWPVLDGTAQPELEQGVGWFPNTGQPGQVGNFGVAAHRRTWGDMFRYLNEVKAGDTVVVRDGNTVYTYRVIEDPVYVAPDEVDVLWPVPGHSGLTRPGRYITLTTCDPVYQPYRRLIVFGELVSRSTASTGTKLVC